MPSHVMPALARRRAPAARPQRANTLETIMKALDAWVAQHGNGKYEDPQLVPMKAFMIPDDAGIQQDRREIKDFVGLLLSRGRLRTVLEIGLGYYGSTHFLWRQCFDRVITVEKSHERIRTFGTNLRQHAKRWVLDDGRSAFLIGMSHDVKTVAKAYQAAPGGLDLLFIDGDHNYDAVLSDWLLYSPLVRPGGLVAFHDIGTTVEGYYGVPQFVEQLSRGEIDGRPRTLQKIIHTKNMGLAYYEQL